MPPGTTAEKGGGEGGNKKNAIIGSWRVGGLSKVTLTRGLKTVVTI